ncbi:hypothetical protein BaRGS_00015664 [Batillaria attramentaria]|uniref:Secreted protein n=1 Tax=Batillaria attramentaria TaxID=370345 RepID=A0ABD0L1P6_9CAEN
MLVMQLLVPVATVQSFLCWTVFSTATTASRDRIIRKSADRDASRTRAYSLRPRRIPLLPRG